jgi:hypothetical protein
MGEQIQRAAQMLPEMQKLSLEESEERKAKPELNVTH